MRAHTFDFWFLFLIHHFLRYRLAMLPCACFIVFIWKSSSNCSSALLAFHAVIYCDIFHFPFNFDFNIFTFAFISSTKITFVLLTSQFEEELYSYVWKKKRDIYILNILFWYGITKLIYFCFFKASWFLI